MPPVGRGTRKLVKALTTGGKSKAPIGPPDAAFGVVVSVQSGSINTVTLRIGGTTSEVVGVEHLASYLPTVGDQVYWHHIHGVPFILGAFGLNLVTGLEAGLAEGVLPVGGELELDTVTAVYVTDPVTVDLAGGLTHVACIASYLTPTVGDSVVVAESVSGASAGSAVSPVQSGDGSLSGGDGVVTGPGTVQVLPAAVTVGNGVALCILSIASPNTTDSIISVTSSIGTFERVNSNLWESELDVEWWACSAATGADDTVTIDTGGTVEWECAAFETSPVTSARDGGDNSGTSTAAEITIAGLVSTDLVLAFGFVPGATASPGGWTTYTSTTGGSWSPSEYSVVYENPSTSSVTPTWTLGSSAPWQVSGVVLGSPLPPSSGGPIVLGKLGTETISGPAPATTVVGPDAFGASPSVGAATGFYALEDHDHGLPSLDGLGWEIATVATVHSGDPNTVDLAGSTSGVPALESYIPYVADVVLVALGTGYGTSGKIAVGTLTVTGAQPVTPGSLIVPSGITAATFVLKGSQGAGAFGGYGSSLTATIPVTPGETLVVNWGTQPAFTGGTGGTNTAGGIAADVRQGGVGLANRVLVAAGGGSQGTNANGTNGAGGAGGGQGGSFPVAGTNGNYTETGGGAATMIGGGSGGTGGAGVGAGGTSGVGGAGAAGGAWVGGGGGDGFYGGGGGAGALGYGASTISGGGGGGTDYWEPSATNVNDQPSAVTGDGSATVTWGTSSGGAVPGAPTGLTAVAGNALVTLTWTAPTNVGGGPIVSYAVYYGTNPASLSLYGTLASGGNVTPLTNGTLYYFAVVAVNTIGAGPMSAQTSATPTSSPPTVPGVPTGLVANPGNAEVTLAWTAPTSDGGSAITSYTVSYGTTSSLGSSVTLASGGSITGLTNNTLYYFAVAAVNTVGTGAESTQATSTPTTGGDTITNWTNPYTSAFTTLLSTWFPSGVTPFPGSAGVVANLVAMQVASGYDMGLNTLPIAVVPSGQANVAVGGSNNNFPSSQAPIPSYASGLISGSGDSPLLVYKPGSASYEMWQATDTSGWSCSDGAYITASAMTDSTGTVDPGGGYGLAASGLAYLGTAVTLADCQRVLNGATDFGHVLALEVSRCDYHALGHFPPAGRNDSGLGSGTSGYPMEGMWFVLPAGAAAAPSNPFALAVYNTLVRYGCIVTDTTQGGGNYLQIEGSADWAAGGGSGTDPLTTLLAGQPTYSVLAPFSGAGSITSFLVQIVPPLTGSPASTPPSAPSGLTLTPSSGQLAASWSGSASMYVVSYRVTGSGTAFRVFYPLITGTSATITGLTNGTSYDVQVWAVSLGGTAASSVVTGTP